ncbi:Exc domain-containing protein [Burkholderia multivorans]
MAAQLIPLRTWAESIFGEYKPHPNTLLNWIHSGKISPAPIKVGSRYFCKPTARYVDPVADEIERMVNGR